MDIKSLSFIKKTPQRKKIFLSFSEIVIPTEIKEKTGITPAQILRTLKFYMELGLIKCLNPDEKMGRLYEITKKGSEILKILYL
jgi:Fe2+ or Zn2+ uptake regulation protein